ncbi:MAG TPA: DUF4902 domain-containing protein [Albitalea sp.]|uniref:DUF4902 domain-containing protein n=1 Tax=Piscinibacter sp. TaxID=1903157 RepID=UPI002ED578E6
MPRRRWLTAIQRTSFMQRSPDGYIRVSLDELLSLPIIHLMSGIDADEHLPTEACGRLTTICGYTEWVSETQPAITIGWDWCLAPDAYTGRRRRIGAPRTNVLLTDDSGADKPWPQSLECIGTVVDALPWSELVPECLSA